MDKNCQCDSDRLGPFLPFSFGEEWPPYSFEVPVSIIPSQDILCVGDTLSVTVNMSDSIKDIIYRSISFKDSAGSQVIDKLNDIEPGQKYKVAGYPFYFSLQLSQLGKSDESPDEDAESAFVVITRKGKTVDDSIYGRKNHYFDYKNGRYELDLKIIPLKKGVFLLNLPAYNEWPATPFPGSCDFRLKRGIRVSFYSGKSNFELVRRTLGKNWDLQQITQNTSSPYNFTISHDTLSNYSGPRAFEARYCFEVK